MANHFLDAFRRRLRELQTADAANVTVTFALAMIPIVGFVGAAVDYSHGNAVKVALQAAADSTALMLSKSADSLNEGEIQTKANEYFNALFVRSDTNSVLVNASYSKTPTPTITLNAATSIDTYFMGIMGITQLNVATESKVKWGNTKLRVALVLDVTGSMASDGKMDALKTATKNLLNQLKSVATQDGDVYVSIIPFNKDVNLDASNHTVTSWLDWTEWEAEPPILDKAQGGSKPGTWYTTGPGSDCPFGTSSSTYGFRCTNGPATSGGGNISKLPSTGNYNGLICPGLDSGNKKPSKARVYYNGCYNSWTKCVGSTCACTTSNTSICSCTGSGASKTCTTNTGYHDHTWRPSASNTYTPALVSNSGTPYATPARSTWKGCVVDRGDVLAPHANNYDTNVTPPSTAIQATRYAAEQFADCSYAAAGLTYNWSDMTDLVNNLTSIGNTNQGLGLQLGWLSLVGGGPFTVPPKDANYKYTDVIILMSDGLNTQNRWWNSRDKIDEREAITCANAKAANVVIFSVQVNTGGDPTQMVLKNCASKPTDQPPGEKFFELKKANELVSTFNSIGTALSNLRIAQ